MDIFVDVLLKHSKELTWMSISAELGCPASESKKLLIETVEAALDSNNLPNDSSIQCIFNGPALDDPNNRQLVQTQALKDNWPPKNYLTSVYGENAMKNSDLCLQTVWLSGPNLEMDKSLVATDDLFHDIYSKAQRSALQDILYVAPFSQCVLSKLGLRSKGTNLSCCGPSKSIEEVVKKDTEPKREPAKIEKPEVATNTPSKPAAKRRKNNPRKLAQAGKSEPTISPVVAVGLTPIVAAPPEIKPAPELAIPPAQVYMDETQAAPAAPTAPAAPAKSLFEMDEDLEDDDDGSQENLLGGKGAEKEPPLSSISQNLMPIQTSGQLKKTTIETSAKGGLGELMGLTGISFPFQLSVESLPLRQSRQNNLSERRAEEVLWTHSFENLNLIIQCSALAL